MKEIDFRKVYKKSWKYLLESRKFIYGVIVLFFFFSLIGFFIVPPEVIQEGIMKFLEELIEKTKDFGVFEMMNFIFWNNLKSSFIGMISGVFFGLFSLVNAISNGYVLGFVGNFSVQENGFLILLRLLPHGIFELPAIFISLGLGFKLGTFIFYSDWKNRFKNYFLNSLQVFILIVLPLLIIAAIIEGLLIGLGI
jgi:stage II sporulation protein M